MGEYDSGGALIQETIWLEDSSVATLRPRTPAVIFYVYADQLNAPRMVTRPSDNKIAWRWDTDPFGTSAPNENPQSLGAFKYNVRFPGQLFDSETSIGYNTYRNYDSQVGRYVESDPVGLRGGLNTYAYVRGNPIKLIDPLGLLPPSPQVARAEAIATGNIQAIETLTAAEEISTAAAECAILEITIKNRSTGSIKQLADLFNRNRKAIEDAIHSCKQSLPRNAPERNSDVVVDKLTGEVYPLLKNGRLGDAIGNILDAMAGH
jgi:RHS repeat-associated protein